MISEFLKSLTNDNIALVRPLFKTAAKEGNILYRHDSNPTRLLLQGNRPSSAPVTAVEPQGLYLSKIKNALPFLKDPHSGELDAKPNVIASLLRPEKELDLLDEDEYIQYITRAYRKAELPTPLSWKTRPGYDIHDSKLKNFYNSLIEDTEAKQYSNRYLKNYDYSSAITKSLLNDKYDAITFNDWIANQPGLEQTVAVRPGSLLAKAGKKVGIISTVLGIGSATLPKYFGRYREGENAL